MAADDKRQYGRVDLGARKLRLTIAIVEGAESTGDIAYIRDISKSGASCYIKNEAQVGLTVRFTLEDFKHEPLYGRIQWCKPTTGDPHGYSSHPFRIGIEFTPADDNAREQQMAVWQYISKLAGVA